MDIHVSSLRTLSTLLQQMWLKISSQSALPRLVMMMLPMHAPQVFFPQFRSIAISFLMWMSLLLLFTSLVRIFVNRISSLFFNQFAIQFFMLPRLLHLLPPPRRRRLLSRLPPLLESQIHLLIVSLFTIHLLTMNCVWIWSFTPLWKTSLVLFVAFLMLSYPLLLSLIFPHFIRMPLFLWNFKVAVLPSRFVRCLLLSLSYLVRDCKGWLILLCFGPVLFLFLCFVFALFILFVIDFSSQQSVGLIRPMPCFSLPPQKYKQKVRTVVSA